MAIFISLCCIVFFYCFDTFCFADVCNAIFYSLAVHASVFFSLSLNFGVSTVKGGLVYKITIFSVFSFLTLLSAAPSLRRRLLAFLQLGQ